MSKRRSTTTSSSISSSNDLQNLTDSELRHRLLQYGFPNMPVTETTRKILIKKLQNHLNNEKTKIKRQASYITRYSSDEESDWIDSQQPPNVKERSSTSARLIDNYRSSSTSPLSNNKMPPPATSTVLGRRSNVIVNNNNNSNHNLTTITPTAATTSQSISSNALPKSSPKIYVPPPILASESDEDSDYRTYSTSPPITISSSSSLSSSLQQQYYNSNPYTPSQSPTSSSPSSSPANMSNSYQQNNSTANITLDRNLNNSWPSHMVGTGAGGGGIGVGVSSYYAPQSSSPNNYTASTHQSQLNGQNSSSYGIDFTRRLLNLRGETIRDSILQKRNTMTSPHHSNLPLRQIHHPNTSSTSAFDPSDIVYRQSDVSGGVGATAGGGINVARYSTNSANDINSMYHKRDDLSPGTAFSRFIARVDEHYGLKQTFIPCALVTLFLLFFILVAFVYITTSPDFINTINEKNTIYEICHPHKSSLASSFDCIEDDHLNGSIELLKLMVPELQKRSEMHYCSDRDQSQSISAREFIKHIHKLGLSTDVRKTFKELHSAEYLIEKNPQWKIDHVDENLNKIDFNEVIRLRHNQGNHFAILQPRLPLTCTLYNRLQEFFIFIGTSALVVGIILIIHFIYNFIQNRRQMKIATIEYLTNEIIAELMRQAVTDTGSSAIIINHLRDKIIPVHKRKEKSWAWNEAIRNLELNDSRIQFDMILKNGEEFKTMRWIANVSMDVFGRSAVKQWHSQAFDKTNKIVQPPTPCLKIRQMFEPAEVNNPHLKQIITDAILEKVGPKCKIYDIQLDKQTCCVYVQCATEADAGIVHNEINGWWFDKRLVSIKFLRLQRYKSRFPNSSYGTKCLQPSNSNNSSMTQCTRNFGAGNNRMNLDPDDDDDDDGDDLDDDEH